MFSGIHISCKSLVQGRKLAESDDDGYVNEVALRVLEMSDVRKENVFVRKR